MHVHVVCVCVCVCVSLIHNCVWINKQTPTSDILGYHILLSFELIFHYLLLMNFATKEEGMILM